MKLLRLSSILSCIFILLLAVLVDAGRDFYKILGIERKASEAEIKKA